MMKRKLNASFVAVLASCLAVALLSWFVIGQYQESVERAFTYIFYNDTSPSDHPNNNSGDVLDASLSTSILSAAPSEVRADPTKYPEWFKEDLYSRLYDHDENSGDPSLLSQLLLDAMLRAPKTVSEKLLPFEEQSIEQWTATINRFIDNPGDHITSAAQLQAVLNRAQRYEVREITGGYTSSGYQKRDGITLSPERAEQLGRNTVPLPVLENNSGVKGYEIVFYFSNSETLSYRINCGYQPDTSHYPSGGKTPTYKPPNISIDIDDPDPTPPPGGEDPDPDPKPSPKDPDGGPQGQNPDNPDYGGGPNTDNDETPTSEPSSPSTYQPPDRPTPAPDSGGSSSSPPSNDGGTETIPVDTDGDGNPDSSFTGEVDQGDPYPDSLDDVHADPPPVESGLNDGQNSGSIGPPK